MKTIFVVLLVTVLVFVVRADSERQARWGGPANVVRFENSVCTTLGGYTGTCYTRWQCRDVNGTGSGSCALNNIGTCCLFQSTCGQTSSFNNTYFVNPGYPNPYTGSSTCSFTIRRCNDNICQVRLDFLSLNLAQPDGNGNCVQDALVITGGASNVPVICGDNSGQHIYVNFNGNTDITLTVLLGALNSLARSWNIKVTQLACDCPSVAPTGCLMYYSSVTGTVNSFNYGTTLNGAVINVNINNMTQTRPGTRQLANNNYGVCIQMLPGYCSIEWSQTAGDPFSFTVTNNTALDEVLGLPRTSLIGTNCTTDFVVIPNPSFPNGTAVPGDRFCGDQFPTVTSSSKPFVLTVVTDGNDLPDIANRGFSLMFRQVPCSGQSNLQTLINQVG